MDLKIFSTSNLNGEITAPPSKSYSHRAFTAAALAEGVSILKNPLTTGDVGVTIDVLRELKVKILRESKNSYIVERNAESFTTIHKMIHCKNSGTTIRIYSALALLIEGGIKFSGEFLKLERPIVPLLKALKRLGGEYKLKKNFLHVYRIQKGCNNVQLPGNISSQFITALLFLCPILRCSNLNILQIKTTNPIISYPYIQITLDVLKSFGVNVIEKIDEERKGTYNIETTQHYRPQVYTIPGDFSSASFIIAATILAKEDSLVIVNNLEKDNPQGDKKIVRILKDMGAKIKFNQEKKQIIVNGNIKKYPLQGIEVDCSDIPDLFPILSVLGAFAKGKMVLHNAGNLRRKECDRISIMARELKKMGVKVEEGEDKLIIHHTEEFTEDPEIDHENDHRIAMACTVASLYSNSETTIKNIEIVKDSYPEFIEDLIRLGANIEKANKGLFYTI